MAGQLSLFEEAKVTVAAAECLLPKQDVVGSNPVTRSTT